MRVLISRVFLFVMAAGAGFFALANRQPVQIAVDFFVAPEPWLAFDIPLFAALFLAFLAGVLVGGLTRLQRFLHIRRARAGE